MLKIPAVFFLLFSVVLSASAQHQPDSASHNQLVFKEAVKSSALIFAPVVPQNFSIKNLPFFCDKEYKLEKLTKIPFRFRLGSVAYCDKMEGKIK